MARLLDQICHHPKGRDPVLFVPVPSLQRAWSLAPGGHLILSLSSEGGATNLKAEVQPLLSGSPQADEGGVAPCAPTEATSTHTCVPV